MWATAKTIECVAWLRSETKKAAGRRHHVRGPTHTGNKHNRLPDVSIAHRIEKL